MSKTIPSGEFNNCDKITSVKFNDLCTSVGNQAFEDCDSLIEINNDNKIKIIGYGAFAKTKLTSVKFNNLKNIIKPKEKTHLGSFEGCDKLTTAYIPNCNEIPERTFSECVNLNSIDIPLCENIGNSAFYNCNKLESVKINRKTNINIGDRSFYNCEKLSDIDFRSIGEIGKNAFFNCSSLKQITLSNSKKLVDDKAFFNCNNLKRVYINTKQDENCIPLGEYVFYNYNLSNNSTGDDDTKNYSIIEGIRFYINADVIDKYMNDNSWKPYIDYMCALAKENQIIYTTIDNSKIDIDGADQEYNENLNQWTATFERNIFYFDKEYFKGNTKLTSIIIPRSCSTIDKNEFEGCTNLKEFISSPNLIEIHDYAFKNCTSLEEFTIPDTINYLGVGIFAGCENIKKFEGKFVTYDGKAIVYNNTLICVLPKDDSITEGRYYKISDIDKTIKTLGEYCFYGCENFRRVDISSDINEVKDYAFYGCTNLYEIHLDKYVTFGENVFERDKENNNSIINENLKIFVKENNLGSLIDEWLKYDLLKYVYPKPNNNCIIYYGEKRKNSSDIHETYSYVNGDYYRIENIGTTLYENYFTKNESIEKVILGEKITKISDNAFKNCTKLEYIHLSDTITKIGNECFYGCTNLTSIYIPNSYKQYNINNITQSIPSQSRFGDMTAQSILGGITEFGYNIFYKCEKLKEFISLQKGFVSDDGMCYIDGNSLRFFAQGGLNNYIDSNGEISYVIPDNVVEINKYAFKETNIENITIGKSTKTIGEGAFNTCTYLKSINGWDNVETISQGAFSSCINIEKISLPTNLKTISDMAFNMCEKMYLDTNMPDTVTEIGREAFAGCVDLKCTEEDLVLKLGNIKQINSSTFGGCISLTKVNINDNITEIGDSAFQDCINLRSVSISENSKLKSIGSFAFQNCTKLNKMNLPESLTNIGQQSFQNCLIYKGNNDTNGLTIPKSVKTIGVSCFQGTEIENLNILEGSMLEVISDKAFFECKNLNKINISSSENISRIGKKAFENCINLTCDDDRLIPVNVKVIDDNAFNGCNSIKNVTLPVSEDLKLGNLCFATGTSNTTINIPEELITPPVFTINGKDSVESYPFGLIEQGNENKIPILSIPSNIILKYIQNIYWRKYFESNNNFISGNVQGGKEEGNDELEKL
jgi:hypothetical protein